MGSISLESIGPRSSLASPKTLIRRPRHARPTGTVIGAPVSSTVMPRVRPSVAPIAIARTVLSPRWLATSQVKVVAAPLEAPLPALASLILMALYMPGSLPGGNSTSKTGPITCTIFPMFIILSLLLELRGDKLFRLGRFGGRVADLVEAHAVA